MEVISIERSTYEELLTSFNSFVSQMKAMAGRGTDKRLGEWLDNQNIYTQQLTDHGLIVMGNEGNGISDAVRARVNRRLLIPDFHEGDTADSLNVAIATAITCSEFRRRGL